jgi:thiamine-phosphate pyrophosphorylase
MIALPRLYAIADAQFGNPVEIAGRLFEGGARLVQVRNKTAGAGVLMRQVEEVLQIAPADGLVLVNDRVDVARLSKAHGVHLGQDDLRIEDARAILGELSLVGFSTHNAEQAVAADRLPVDYIAVGPIFHTNSKKNPDPVLGIDRLAQICRAVRKPVVAIGGITLEQSSEVYDAGAASIAVIGDLLRYQDVVERTRLWVRHSSCPV